VGRGLIAVLVHPEGWVEDLEREVGVERRCDIGERTQVAVDEFSDAYAVVNCSGATSSTHKEGAFWKAEVLLDVDQ
jgi:hypothetical protein